MEDNKQLVIVLSRNYSTGLSVIRSLGEAGYTVDLVASAYKKGTMQIAASSKYVRNFTEVVSPKVKDGEGNQALIDALMKRPKDEGPTPVLFPTDDYTASVMDQFRSVLETRYIFPTIIGGKDGCMTARMDKTWQSEAAREAGLLTPQEWLLSLEEEIVIPEDMVYPCFCKPIESVSGYKKEMARCSSERSLRTHLKKLKASNPHRSVLVQEFLKIDNEIDLSGVCLDQEIIIPAIIKKWNVAKYEKGVTLAGKVVAFEELGDLCDKVIALLKRFRYFGMFDMELNIVGDKIYFNEVNLRSGGPNFSYFMSGVNLPALFVKEALGQKHKPEEARVSKLGQSFVYEKVAWEDYLHGFMTKQELKDRLEAADIFLLDYAPDPEPGKLFAQQMKKAITANRIKKFKLGIKRSKIYKTLRRFKRKLIRGVRAFKRSFRRAMRPVVKLLRQIKYTLLGYPQMKRKNRRHPFADKPRAVVCGRNYCSNLCMARSLGEAGYEVEVLRLFQVKPKWHNLLGYLKPDAYSRYIKAYHLCVSHRKSMNIVRRLIRIADPYRKMLLVPVDDLVASVVDEHYNRLSKYYILPNVNKTQGELSRLMSKDVQKELAIAAGLPVINSCSIKTHRHQFEIPETVSYPCFIKPNISKNSSKGRMCRCDSKEELHDILKKYSAHKDVDILVEDFIDIAREYSILGLSTKDGVVAPGFFGALEGGHGPHRGVAMTGELLRPGKHKKLVDEICRFIETLNYEGLFDVDLIEDKDGKMYFVELNLRYGASGYAVTRSGANLPGMYADYMVSGTPVDKHCKLKEYHKPFISEKIMIDEYVNGYITGEEMKKHFASADIHFIMSKDDPKSYRHFRKFYFLGSVMKFVRNLKNPPAAQGEAKKA